MAEATSFNDFVKDARDKKKKESLAQEFLGSRGRKGNAPASGSGSLQGSAKPTLLSRMSSNSGVNKSRSSSAKPSPSIDGKWQHDLHKLNNPQGSPNRKLNRAASASQIDRNTRAFDKFHSVLQKNARKIPQKATSKNGAAGADASGFSIRGVAAGGPWTIIASNFAPGTTAHDIEMVVGQHGLEFGGELLSCRLISSTPTVMAELVFTERKGADNVISIFNNTKADGRVLYVYLKDSSNSGPSNPRPARGGQSSADDMDLDTNGGARSGGSYTDGRWGFNEGSRRDPPKGPRR